MIVQQPSLNSVRAFEPGSEPLLHPPVPAWLLPSLLEAWPWSGADAAQLHCAQDTAKETASVHMSSYFRAIISITSDALRMIGKSWSCQYGMAT
ncbi:hypothetical protein [Stenotrophomonas phage CM2]